MPGFSVVKVSPFLLISQLQPSVWRGIVWFLTGGSRISEPNAASADVCPGLCWNLSAPEKILSVLDPSAWDPLPISSPYFASNLAILPFSVRCWPHGISSAPLYTSSFIRNFCPFLTFCLIQWCVLTAFHGQPLCLGARPAPSGLEFTQLTLPPLSCLCSLPPSLLWATQLAWGPVFTLVPFVAYFSGDLPLFPTHSSPP